MILTKADFIKIKRNPLMTPNANKNTKDSQMTFKHKNIVTEHSYLHNSEVIKFGKFGSDFPDEIERAEEKVYKKYGVHVKYMGGSYSGCNFKFSTYQNPNILEAAVIYFDNILSKELKGKL